MRRAARKDENQKEIVDGLRAIGASVFITNAKGLPDLIVGFRGKNYLLEVKQEKGKLKPDQEEFFESWKGQATVVRSLPSAVSVIANTPSGSETTKSNPESGS